MISPTTARRLAQDFDNHLAHFGQGGSLASGQILRTQYKISDILAWQRAGALQLKPLFQRRSVWKKTHKSFLIDTILRDLPMPIIIIRDVRSDPKTLMAQREVVDGQQRIRTILSFIDPASLPDFDPKQDEFTVRKSHNKEFAGKKFVNFAPEDRRKVLDYQFSVHIFSADTDDREILQIFARMNATGLKLNAQELRNSQFSGDFKTLAYKLALEQLNRWRNWKVFSADQIARMLEAEMTSEFMLLIMSGILQKKNTTLETYYDKYDDDFPGSDQVAQRFRNTFDAIEKNFDEDEIKRFFSNRSVFYALFATVYQSQYGLSKPDKKYIGLPNMKPATLKAAVIANIKSAATKIKDETAPQKVLRAARGATAHEKNRRILIDYLAGD